MEPMQSKSEKFRIENSLQVIDQFISALEHRLGTYELISSGFGFLSKLDVLSLQEILRAASNLVVVYNDDLDVCLGNVFVQFAKFVNAFKDEQDESVNLRQSTETLASTEVQSKTTFLVNFHTKRQNLSQMSPNSSVSPSFL